jgi:hypothetical protein
VGIVRHICPASALIHLLHHDIHSDDVQVRMNYLFVTQSDKCFLDPHSVSHNSYIVLVEV